MLLQRIKYGWNVMRFIRLIIGIFIVIQAVNTQHVSGMIIGSIFVLFPLLNIGCCAGSSCAPTYPNKKINAQKSENVQYEEVTK